VPINWNFPLFIPLNRPESSPNSSTALFNPLPATPKEWHTSPFVRGRNWIAHLPLREQFRERTAPAGDVRPQQRVGRVRGKGKVNSPIPPPYEGGG
jgi:hypothetical protein